VLNVSTNRQARVMPWLALEGYQNTLATAVVFQGIGTHSAQQVTMTVHPAPEDTGIVFSRTDLSDGPHIIPARWDHVTDTMMCTKISNADGVSVSTIEHIMAALYACEIDNAFIEVNGPEVPIMDGSSDDFIAPLLDAGVASQDSPRRTIEVLKTVIVRDQADRWISISPHDEFFIDMEFHFAGKADFPTQHFTDVMTPEIFQKDIAAARTFAFAEDVMKLRSMGLAQGSSLETGIGIQDGKVMNPEGLRFENEFVRHKVLDAVGDLYTAGAGFKACIRGTRTGHSMHNQLLRALFSNPANWRYV
jgi:UDP-3-O-[3-hydroxymyristoyl] N-acetylglucosamine deacetylase